MGRRSAKVKECRRCKCTEDRACAGGCEWVAGTDVCSACLTTEEGDVWRCLLHDLENPNYTKIAKRQLKLFGQMIVLGTIGVPF